MKAIRQEDGMGCAVASVAFVLQIPYVKALSLFDDGTRRVTTKANFYCPEIVSILNNQDRKYTWKQLTTGEQDRPFPNLSIVFVTQSVKLPFGHFLARYQNEWMDSWINAPLTPIEAGFRQNLPGQPTHLIYPIQ